MLPARLIGSEMPSISRRATDRATSVVARLRRGARGTRRRRSRMATSSPRTECTQPVRDPAQDLVARLRWPRVSLTCLKPSRSMNSTAVLEPAPAVAGERTAGSGPGPGRGSAAGSGSRAPRRRPAAPAARPRDRLTSSTCSTATTMRANTSADRTMPPTTIGPDCRARPRAAPRREQRWRDEGCEPDHQEAPAARARLGLPGARTGERRPSSGAARPLRRPCRTAAAAGRRDGGRASSRARAGSRWCRPRAAAPPPASRSRPARGAAARPRSPAGASPSTSRTSPAG